MYVIDNGSSEVVKFSIDWNNTSRTGGYGWNTTSFNKPSDIISPNGLDIYISDYGNHRVLRLDKNLNLLSIIPSDEQNQNRINNFRYPLSISLSKFGKLYILDGENKRLVMVSQSNSFENIIGENDAGKGRLKNPKRVRISNKDRIYIQDENRINVYDIFGNYIHSIGDGLFQHFKTFTVDDDAINVLDSCFIHQLDLFGKLKRRINLGGLIRSCGDIVDIGIMDKDMFLLMKKNILMVKKENIL